MADKDDGKGGYGIGDAFINYMSPNLERLLREIAPKLAGITAPAVDVLRSFIGKDPVDVGVSQLPNLWSMAINALFEKLPWRLSVEGAVVGASTRFWEAYANHMLGKPNTAENHAAAAKAGERAAEDYLAQKVSFDRAAFFHLEGCPLFFAKGAITLKQALDAHNEPGCPKCQRRFLAMQPKADEAEATSGGAVGAAKKKRGGPGLRPGASLAELLGYMLEYGYDEEYTIIVTWLASLSKAKYEKVEGRLSGLDTVEEAVAIAKAPNDAWRERLLNHLERRKQERKDLFTRVGAKVTAVKNGAIACGAIALAEIAELDQQIVSDDAVQAAKDRTAQLLAARQERIDSRQTRANRRWFDPRRWFI